MATAAGADKFAHHIFDLIHASVEKTKDARIPATAFVLMTINPEDGTPFDGVFVGDIEKRSETSEEDFHATVRKIAEAGKAIGVLFVERFVVLRTNAETMKNATNLKDVAESKDTTEGRIVFASFEHVRFSGVRCWRADIEDESKINEFVSCPHIVVRASFLAFQN